MLPGVKFIPFHPAKPQEQALQEKWFRVPAGSPRAFPPTLAMHTGGRLGMAPEESSTAQAAKAVGTEPPVWGKGRGRLRRCQALGEDL